MTARSVSTFQKRCVAVLQGEHNPFEFVPTVLTINIILCSMGNTIGKVLSVILSQWLNIS